MEHYPKSVIVNIDAYNRFHTNKPTNIFHIQDEGRKENQIGTVRSMLKD